MRISEVMTNDVGLQKNKDGLTNDVKRSNEMDFMLQE